MQISADKLLLISQFLSFNYDITKEESGFIKALRTLIIEKNDYQ